jgi:hypothetical protein
MADQVMTGRFVGRAEELARLGELLARAATGEPLLVLIGGRRGSARPGWWSSWPPPSSTRACGSCVVAACRWARRACRSRPVVQALRGLARDLDAVELEADEVGASLKWATAKVERTSQRGNGGRAQGRERQAERGDFNDPPF